MAALSSRMMELNVKVAEAGLKDLGVILKEKFGKDQLCDHAMALLTLRKDALYWIPAEYAAVAAERDLPRVAEHGTSWESALKILTEGFVGAVKHERVSLRTQK